MKCPFCGYDNIAGTDLCENCQEDLMSIDREVPKTKVQRFIMQEPLTNIPYKEAPCATEDESILDAVKKMSESKTGCVLVKNREGQLSGILTERDVLFRVLGRVKDFSKTKVSNVMTLSVETLDEDDTLAYALHKMSINRFRHIPIIQKEKEPGVITALDLLKYLSKSLP